jgi:hypothetical protein
LEISLLKEPREVVAPAFVDEDIIGVVSLLFILVSVRMALFNAATPMYEHPTAYKVVCMPMVSTRYPPSAGPNAVPVANADKTGA